MKLRNQIMPLNANTPCDNTIRCLKVMTYKTDNVAKTRLSGRLLLLLLLSRTSDSVLPHRRQPARLPRPSDSPGNFDLAGDNLIQHKIEIGRQIKVFYFHHNCSTYCL